MASAVSYEGPYYTGSNSISFRSLQTNFGGNSNNVKFSTYYRNTNVDESDPIVPDATENASIPTTSTIEASNFRDSIKKYYVTQSGGESNYDIDAQSWNSNLAKNILKESRINGTITSSSTSNTAATFDATAYNMKIVVSGAIYGHEGYGANPKNNGTAASSAMFVNNTSSRTATASNVTVSVNSAGKIYGGGGGGGGGGDGSGASISCYNQWGYGQNVLNSDRGYPRPGACDSCPSSSTSPEGFAGNYYTHDCFPSRGRARCRLSHTNAQGKPTPGDGPQGTCYATWDRLCVYRRYVTLSSGGGTGGNGGHGQGANRLSGPQSGNGGNSGGRSYCAANNTRATGNSGGSGGRGGYFGENGSAGSGNGAGNGGSGGAAIYRSGGRPYNVQGASSSNIKGNY